MPIYETARNKVAWAHHHIEGIETRIDCLKKALVVTSHVNPETGCEFIKGDFADTTQGAFVDELALRLGDAIHNLKCALDHAWFQTITRLIPVGDWRQAKFPVYPTPDGLKRFLEGKKIDVSHRNFCRFLLGEIKPYDGGNVAIRPIHLLNRRDKHMLLIPVVHYCSIGNIHVKDKRGKIHKGGTFGTIQALPHFVNFERGLHVEDPGKISFEILFQYGKAGEHAGMVDMLKLYSHQVLMVVKLLEKFEE